MMKYTFSLIIGALVASLGLNLVLYQKLLEAERKVPFSTVAHSDEISSAIQDYAKARGVSANEVMLKRFAVAVDIPSQQGDEVCVALKNLRGVLGRSPTYCFKNGVQQSKAIF